MTFGLSAHGLGVGDRIWLGVIPNSLASPPLSGPQFGFWIVTAVPDTSHFTVQSLAITQAAIATALVADGIAALVTFAAAKDTGGHFLSLAYLCAFQSGRTQNDITSGAEATGTQGAAITPFTIVTDGASTPNAQGVPSGIGLASGILTGTPVQFGWFPVTLIVGTMQRLCLFSIAAGTDEALLLAPQTIMTSPGATALAVVSAPGLAGLTVNWLLGNAVTGVTITSDAPTLATVSGTFATAGTYPFMVFALASNGTILQEEITFEVLGASSSGNVPVIAAPVIPSVAAGAVINSQFYASNEPTVWSANGLPTELTLTAATGTLTGVINFPGVYTFEVIATNGVGSSTPAPVTLTVTVPAGNTIAMNAQQPPQYLGWVMSDLSQIDLQFDLRGRGVTSYHAASGVITLFQNGVCNFALLLFTPAQVSDATTIYLVAKTVEDSVPVIDLTFTGSAALTTVGGGSYYALPVSMQASAITQGFDDMSAPTGGGPRVLALQAQVVALRGGNLYPSLPFTLNIMERIANAGLPGDQP
jgi:hypothetical protein